jgi:hypothetical protein
MYTSVAKLENTRHTDQSFFFFKTHTISRQNLYRNVFLKKMGGHKVCYVGEHEKVRLGDCGVPRKKGKKKRMGEKEKKKEN